MSEDCSIAMEIRVHDGTGAGRQCQESRVGLEIAEATKEAMGIGRKISAKLIDLALSPFRWFRRKWRHLLLWAILFVILIASSLFILVQHWRFHPIPEPITNEQLNALDLAQEDARLAKLITLPTGDGNACYDLMEALHELPFDGKNGSHIPYEWWHDIDSLFRSDAMADEWRLLQYSLVPELDIYRRAAQKKDYHSWGVAIKQQGLLCRQPLPSYNDFIKLNKLGIVRARELEKEGKNEQALAWYFDLLRIANHLERDGFIPQLIAGINKRMVSQELVSYYERSNDLDSTEKWWEYFEYEDNRLQTVRKFWFALYNFKYSSCAMSKLVENQDISPSTRMWAYELLVYRSCFGSPRKLLFGPSSREKELLLNTYYISPALRSEQSFARDHVNGGLWRRIKDLISYLRDYYSNDWGCDY